MATHKVTLAVEGSGVSRSKDISNTQAGVALIDGETVATAETDYELNFDLDVSACKSFYLESDQDVTFETNDGAAPGNTIALKANKAYLWHVDAYDSFLLTVDVTSVFITNASGSTATIYCVALFDVTPP
jgi:hypothetical protein